MKARKVAAKVKKGRKQEKPVHAADSKRFSDEKIDKF